LVRSILTHEFGVSRPTGVAWDAAREVFVVTGRDRAAGTLTARFTADEQARGDRVADVAADAGTAAFDPRSNQVTVLQNGRQVSLGDGTPMRRSGDGAAVALSGVVPAGTTYGPDGTMYVLDAATDDIVSVSPAGSVESISLQGLDGVELRGLAYHPGSGNLYVADASANTLYAVDQAGAVVNERDLADSAVTDVQAMTFAPSGDGTDPAREQSLYIADAGTADLFGSVAEVTFTAAVAPISGGYSETPTVVKQTATSAWTPPSPDPSGVTYIPGQGLLVSDGEVEEMNDGLNDTQQPEAILYEGVNLWLADTDGTPVAGKTGVTTKFSDEPVGLEYDAGRLLVSDDTTPALVYEVANAGGDGIFGTTDDPSATEILRPGGFGNTDPEGVAFDSKRNELLIIDGLNRELFRYSSTDALVRQVDVESLGMDDPEGIAYDADRDTVVVIDHSGIWELDQFGSVLGRIDTKDANIDKPAGITVAPASDGSGGNSFYVVDRGVDNDSNGFENDGVLFEIQASLPDVSDRPPSISAGADDAVDINEEAKLNGQATDPENGTMTYAWTKLNGPGTVTFTGGADKLVTTAGFDTVGTYTLRLTVKDGVWTVVDDVVVTVYQPGSERTIEVPIATGTDDAREAGASVATGRAHNRLGQEINGGVSLTTGLRFDGVPVPQDGQIVSAYIQFQTESVQAGASRLDIRGEAADNAVTFDGALDRSISTRPSTTAKVTGWAPPEWKTVGEAGTKQRTPDLSPILQEIVDRAGWSEDNAAVFVITGTGTRSAESFEGNRVGAPKLVLEYRTDKNTAPSVVAGTDASVKLPANASLDGTVSDDGLPEPATTTTEWSQVSGPGTTTFGNAAAVDTTASFSMAGTYVLRLMASDGVLSGQDDVTVTVAAADPPPPPPPGGSGGGGGGVGGGSTPPPPDDGGETPTDATVVLQSQLSAVQYDGVVRLSGVVAEGGLASEDTTVRVFVSRAPDWRTQELSSAKTDGQGTFTIEDRPSVTSRYYAMVGDASSGFVQVLVRPRLSAALTNVSVLVGTRTAIVGRVSPAVEDHLLRLQRWNGKGWRTVATKSLAGSAEGKYRFAVVPKTSGVARYRVVSPAQGGRARTVSPGRAAGLAVSAYDATVKRVNARADVVVVRNTGTVRFTLAGWWLVEARSGEQVSLPGFVVRPGASVRIHSRAGAGDRRNLYLGTGEMWGVHGVAELRDARLRLADRLRY
jgi:hypothetical protein